MVALKELLSIFSFLLDVKVVTVALLPQVQDQRTCEHGIDHLLGRPHDDAGAFDSPANRPAVSVTLHSRLLQSRSMTSERANFEFQNETCKLSTTALGVMLFDMNVMSG